MKITVNTKAFSKTLKEVNTIVATNPVLPILECLLLEVDTNSITIIGSNLQVFYSVRMEAISDYTGAISVPAKLLTDTVSNLSSDEITLITNDVGLEIKSGRGKYKCATLDGLDFPKPNSDETTSSFIVSGDDLLKGFNNVSYAASNDDMRPAMTGVFVESNEGILTFVSTDAHILAMQALQFDGAADLSFVVPKSGLSLLKNYETYQVITVSSNTSNIVISTEDRVLNIRLIDAQFPNYKAVFPTTDKTLVVNKTDIISALKVLSNYASQRSSKCTLSIASDTLTISTEDYDFGREATETLPCEFDSKDFTISFNIKNLLKVLGRIATENVVFGLSAPNQAGIISPENDSQYQVLVMPLM